MNAESANVRESSNARESANVRESNNRVRALQRKNIELAKANASLTLKLAATTDALLASMQAKLSEQDKRLQTERKLMEAMGALEVLKVEVGKRVPVMECVAGHLMETAGLFKHLLQLDYGEILVERLLSGSVATAGGATKEYRLPTIPEEP